MTLSTIFRWKHPDSTADLNARLTRLSGRGIYWGGTVTPGVGLTVSITPFLAVGYDGMTVADNATSTVTVVAGQTNYVVVRAKYNASGSPATPTLSWENMSSAAYAADPEKDYLIVFAVVTLAGGAVSVTTSDISFLSRDEIDPMGRSPFRGIVANVGALPAHPPVQNRTGDIYFVQSVSTFYWWTGSAWSAFSTGSFNVETASMMDVVIDGERNRKENGTGIISGKRPDYDFASEPDVSIIETASVDSQFGIDTFSAVINGHYVQPYARNITLPAKGDRYDLVFLEVYREAIAVPENHTFPINPDGTWTYTITQVSDQVEQVLWQAGTGGNNFDVNELQADDHTWLVTKYRFGYISPVTGANSEYLYDATHAATQATNVDGNPFAATPGTGIDRRVWRATSATSADGYSYAIPLYVVRRTSAENHAIGDGIKEYRSGERYIFPVYPVSDIAHASKMTVDANYRSTFSTYQNTSWPYEKHSGFIDNLDYDIQAGVAANAIRFYSEEFRARIRGIEDNISFSPTDVVLDAPPAASYERTLVYLQLSLTLYDDQTTKSNTYSSYRNKPFFPSSQSGSLKGMGWKRGNAIFEVKYYNAGATDILDEADAMAAAGWTKGDLSAAGVGKEYEDGGIWSKSVAIDVDNRIHPYLYQWAIPICLIHRRNSAAWDYASNPNGSTGRPDGRISATTIYADDLLDLRRLVDVDMADAKRLLERDISKVMSGTLRTRMAHKWGGAGAGATVAGTRILQSDHADVGGAATAFQLPVVDGDRKIWSDAREFIPVAEAVDLTKTINNTFVAYNHLTKVLQIKAPAAAGMSIVRNLPSTYIADADTSNATYLDFLGQPCWSTEDDFSAAHPTPVSLRWVNVDSGSPTPVEDEVFDGVFTSADPAFSVDSVDALGRATQMSCTLTGASALDADVIAVSFWVHQDRSPTGNFAGNHGLAEIPDVVHSATKGPASGTPKELNIGTLYTTVRKTVNGASTTTVSSADILAASGVSGTTATIVGFDAGGLRYSTTPAFAFSSATMTSTQDSLTINWGGNLVATTVDIPVFFYTDEVTEWIEVGRGGKSMRALYSWHEEDINFGGAPPAATAFILNKGIWHDIELAAGYSSAPIVWKRNTAGATPWTYHGSYILTAAGHRYSNLVSFDPSATDQYIKVVVPKWLPPAANLTDEVLVHYTYTPYQGMSSTGGAKATPATALTKLKNMIHGNVVADSDWYVTQSGACSVFGGVDTWSGKQARVPQFAKNMSVGHFNGYVQTGSVRPTGAYGMVDFGRNISSVGNDIAGAIMRLPFPADPSMLDIATVYHDGTMDWDIDPGREGASAGFFNYAPAYPAGLLSLNNNGYHRDQWLNSITPLAIPGQSRQQDFSTIIPPCSYEPDSSTTSGATYTYSTVADAGWAMPGGGDNFEGDARLPLSRGNIAAFVSTKFVNMAENAGAYDIGSGNGINFINPNSVQASSGVYNYHDVQAPLYTAPLTLDGTTDVLICASPGTVCAYASNLNIDVYPWLHLRITTIAASAVNRILQHSFVLQERSRVGYAATSYFYASSRPDLIRLPLGSVSLRDSFYGPSVSGGSGGLVGKTIGYPSSWGAATVTAVESLVQASKIFYSTYGRGVYLGSSTRRYSMPVLVPGSGTPLSDLSSHLNFLVETTAQPPESFPSAFPYTPFENTPRRWDAYDHGGPIAYGFYGLMINPSADSYKGQLTFQISGGPTMGTDTTLTASLNPEMLDGTAIDAFWPTGRPLVRNGQ